jgi:xanthine dehydrogenase accessory factor
MKEISEIVKAYQVSLSAGRKTALATVVQVEGSAYRRAGARMLVDDEGNMTGAISGGCLEGDALRKAQLAIAKGEPVIVVYDTSDEDDISIGVQLGCAGIIHVLFEPIGPNHSLLHWFDAMVKERSAAVLVTGFSETRADVPLGTCLLMRESGTLDTSLPDALKDDVAALARQALTEEHHAYSTLSFQDQSITFFAEYIPAAVCLVVVGAGNDAIPLVNIGTELGWDVKVVDGRGTHAKPERFVSACQVLVSKPEKVLEEISIDGRTFFVLMTHNYRYDLAMLKALLQEPARYIGILGPRKKLQRMLNELTEEGMVITDEMLSRIHGPVGLELGAETAAEIALSITAEILSVINHASAQPLREKPVPIHSK